MRSLIRTLAALAAIIGCVCAASPASAAPLPLPNLQLGDSSGTVRAIVPLADGSVLIGGVFQRVNGMMRKGIAHLNADGSVDTAWNADVDNGNVDAIVVSGSFVYFGGAFGQVGGQPRNNLARVSLADGSVSTTWSADVSAFVHALATDGTDLFVGGEFSTIGGQSRGSLARVSLASGAVSAWTNDVTRSGFVGSVESLSLDGAFLYVGGSFDAAGGQARSGLARVSLSSSNSTDPTWIASTDSSGDVRALAIYGAQIYAGGSFNQIGGVAMPNVARISTTAGAAVDAGWAPPPATTVRALLVDSSGIIAAATFYGSANQSGLAELDPGTGAVTSWNPVGNGNFITSSALAFAGGDVLVGVDQAHSKPSLFRAGRSGALDATFRAFAGFDNARISAVALANDGGSYVGGDIEGAEGLPIWNLLRVRPDGTLDTIWHPDPDDAVEALALSGSDLVAGGAFTKIGGIARNYLAKISTGATATVDPAWNPDPNALVTQAVTDGSDVYVAGYFSTLSGTPRICIAKLSLSGSGIPDPAWNANWSGGAGSVTSMVVGGASLFVGGSFVDSEAGQSYLLKLSKATGVRDASWNPAPGWFVADLAFAGGQLFAAGAFTHIGGIIQRYVARIDASTGTVDPAWMPQLPNFVTVIAEQQGVIYVSNNSSVNGRTLSGVSGAISAASGRPDFAWSSGFANAGVIRARSGQIWLGFYGNDYGVSRIGVAAYPPAACTGQPDNTPCDGGPGISGATCQASICTPAVATTATSLSVTVNHGPPFGTTLTMTATVSSSGSPASGTVTFYDKLGTRIGYGLVSGGSVTDTAYGFDYFRREIVAIYEGSEQHAPSRSAKALVGAANGTYDINGDGRGDAFFRKSDGTNYVWHINGAVITGGVVQIASQGLLPLVDTSWFVAGMGDFNGDGKADILWRNSSGTNYVWHLDGSSISGGVLTIVSQGLLPTVDSTWTVAGIGDFNGDGKSDILWRKDDGTNYIWHVDGATITGGVLAIASQGLLPGVDTSWSVAGIGDFNGDGKSDILWRKSDGTNYVWNVEGAVISGGMVAIGSQGLLPAVDNTWTVVATGDYNGDGKSDIFFRRGDGTNYIWHLDSSVIAGGLVKIGSQGLLPTVDSSWEVVGQGDYNGDGRSDVFWRKTDGTNYIWHVDGATINGGVLAISSQGLLPSVDATWTVVNPK